MTKLDCKYSFDILTKQIEVLNTSNKTCESNYIPVQGIDFFQDFDFSKPFGVVVLAGGQGSRLGMDAPKGCFQLSDQETLFSFLIKKLQGLNAYLAIMTSSGNHDETVQFFQKNHFFDFEKNRIDFFIQESWPVLDLNHKWAMKTESELFEAPLGNGSMYLAFCGSPILMKWKNLGIQAINVLPVDNLMGDPRDEKLLGAIENGYDLAVRGIEKEENEKVGMLVKKNDRLNVIEYSEAEIAFETLAYSGLFSVSLKFLEEAAQLDLPLHIAHKEGVCFENNQYSNSKIIKFEKFIFDAFFKAEKNIIINTCRKKYFRPLKDKEGPYGIQAIREIYKKVAL